MAEAKCTFHVHLADFDKTYVLKKISKTYLVKELQARIELVCGIPISIQRLHYLDKAELNGDSPLLTLDIVNGATFTLHTWKKYVKLLKAIFENNATEFKSYLETWIRHRDLKIFLDVENVEKSKASVYLAAHLGQIEILKLLKSFNIDLDITTPCGHTPLHAAIANGKYQCIDFLLDNGVQFEKHSIQSQNAALVGKHNGFNDSDRHVYLFNWQIRAKKQLFQPVENNVPLMMHQMYDSGNKTWLDGKYATRYMCSSVKKSNVTTEKVLSQQKDSQTLKDEKLPVLVTSEETHGKEEREQVFNEWLQKKKYQKRFEAEKRRQEKLLEDIQKIEKEKQRRYSQRKLEHERKNRVVREDVEKTQKRTNIYDEYTNRLTYGRSILNQLIHESNG